MVSLKQTFPDRTKWLAAVACLLLVAVAVAEASAVNDVVDRALGDARGGNPAVGIGSLTEELERELTTTERIAVLGALGDIHFYSGDLKNAFTRYREVIALDAAVGRAHFMMGLVLQQQFDTIDEAIDAFETAIKSGYATSEAYSSLGLSYKTAAEMVSAEKTGAEQYYRRAEASLGQALVLDSENLSARGNLADLYYNLGRPREAIAGYEGLLSRMPDDATVLVRLGDAHLVAGNLAAAIETLEKVEKRYRPLEPKAPPDEYFANMDMGTSMYLSLALAHGRKGDEDRALSYLERLVEISECPECTHESYTTSDNRKKAQLMLNKLKGPEAAPPTSRR